MFKYHLHFLNSRSKYMHSDLAYAFNKWKNYDLTRKKELIKLQKHDLERKCIKQADQMEECAKRIDDCEQTIEELTSQRDMLLKSFVGS